MLYIIILLYAGLHRECIYLFQLLLLPAEVQLPALFDIVVELVVVATVELVVVATKVVVVVDAAVVMVVECALVKAPVIIYCTGVNHTYIYTE